MGRFLCTARYPRTWRKLHLAVDASTNTIVAATLTTNSDGDAGQVIPPRITAVPGSFRWRASAPIRPPLNRP